MKWLLIVAFSLLAGTSLKAQAVWSVKLNGKEVLNTSTEDEEKNTVGIKKSDLKKGKNLVLVYKEGETKPGWERSIIAYDSKDKELSRQKGSRFQLSDVTLQSFFKKSKTIKIYTIALPTDPKLMAAVRVRRVHLCKLVVKP